MARALGERRLPRGRLPRFRPLAPHVRLKLLPVPGFPGVNFFVVGPRGGVEVVLLRDGGNPGAHGFLRDQGGVLPLFHAAAAFCLVVCSIFCGAEETRHIYIRRAPTMPTDSQYVAALRDMEAAELRYLEHALRLALMEEPWEQAQDFYGRLRAMRTLGQVRHAVREKISQHGFALP